MGVIKKDTRLMPTNWCIIVIMAFVLLGLGNVLLHYAWYKIANMPVSWMLDSPICMPPAPKPFWSKGPWN